MNLEASTPGVRRPPHSGGPVPGVVVSVVIALVAVTVHSVLPAVVAGALGALILGLAGGMVVANTVGVPAVLQPGIRLCVTTVLRAAIVLLGARLALSQVLAIGGKAVVMIAVLMTTALVVARLLARATGTAERIGTLVGLGVSVCGNSAIVAAAPVIGASDDEVATALTVNTLFGTLAVFTYPLIARAVGMTPAVFGTWAGTAVNDTSQVVAVGFAMGALGGELATTVKLARNALMGVAIAAAGMLHPEAAPGRRISVVDLVRRSFPLFVVAFLAMAVANSIGLLAALSAALELDVIAVFTAVAQFLLVVALAAVGLSTSFAALWRTGPQPFLVGMTTALVTSALSLALIAAFGPAT